MISTMPDYLGYLYLLVFDIIPGLILVGDIQFMYSSGVTLSCWFITNAAVVVDRGTII